MRYVTGDEPVQGRPSWHSDLTGSTHEPQPIVIHWRGRDFRVRYDADGISRSEGATATLPAWILAHARPMTRWPPSSSSSKRPAYSPSASTPRAWRPGR